MSHNLTQPEEIDRVLVEFSDYFVKSEIANPKKPKPKLSKEISDDDFYIPLYKISSFN
jgi:hypothetical protein